MGAKILKMICNADTMANIYKKIRKPGSLDILDIEPRNNIELTKNY